MNPNPADAARRSIEAIWHLEAAKVIGRAARIVHDIGLAYGPAAALEQVDQLQSDPALQHYHPLPAERADLLSKLGRLDEACAEFQRAAALTKNARERAFFLAKATGNI